MLVPASAGGVSFHDALADGLASSDLVLVGTVGASRNLAPTDGGRLYQVEVSEVLKGPGASRVQVQAGGFRGHVALPKGGAVLLFLRAWSKEGSPEGQLFSLVSDADDRVLAFAVDGGQLRPVAAAPGDWDGQSLDRVRRAAAGSDD